MHAPLRCAQEELIGAEQEGRKDEKRRAALHAQWLARQDEAAVEQLLHGVKNGFRRRRHALDDEARAITPVLAAHASVFRLRLQYLDIQPCIALCCDTACCTVCKVMQSPDCGSPP